MVDVNIASGDRLTPPVLPFRTPDQQILVSSTTWDPIPGAKYYVVEVQGGGGAGGGAPAAGAGNTSCGCGGEGGSYVRSLIPASEVTGPVTVTVGAGGTPASGATGGNGATSSFGSQVSAAGGAGGTVNGPNTSIFAVPGPLTSSPSMTGDIQIRGGGGGASVRFGAAQAIGGAGGTSHLGAPGPTTGSGNSGANGIAGGGYGAGGSGACNNGGGAGVAARSGGAGAPGVVIITAIF
ncbi:hypothetical protein ACFP2T_13460 [Plantactinospora solaniradicis]|uniref:Glycine-rich domain-containing protein n=1 Tax=Plantactinospora solaniradicis TaxID=1723736 RepID=A0ABW1K6V1_9ACTN